MEFIQQILKKTLQPQNMIPSHLMKYTNSGLNVMDLTAFTLCKENNLPIVVFDMDTVGNLEKVLADKNIGTLVSN